MIELPKAYADRMKRMLGDAYEAFLASYERERRPSLRVNTLQAGGQNFAAVAPWELARIPWAAGGYSYKETDRPGKHAFHEAGVYYIQEASAMAVAALSGVQPGERILDLCAAPGGKTTQLAAMMQGRGVLIANEIGPTRARILSQNVERMGIRSCIVTNETPARLADRFPYYFDRVIVDAPCSGEGMFRSKDEAMPLWSQEHVTQCAARQQDILDEAARMVGPGGVLVYSTCTFAPEEDEESVAAFVAAHPDFEIVDLLAMLGEHMAAWGFQAGDPAWCRTIITYEDPGDLRHVDDYVSQRYGTTVEVPEEIRGQLSRTIRLFPHRMGGEGHFLALLRKAGTRIPSPYTVADDGRASACDGQDRRVGRKAAGHAGARISDGCRKDIRGNKKPEGRAGKGRDGSGRAASLQDAVSLWQAFAGETLICDIAHECAAASGSVFLLFGDELYLEPAGIPLAGLKVVRPGLHLGTVSKGRFTPSQALAEALSPEDAVRVRDIEDGEAEDGRDAAAYLRGESLSCDPSLKGWTLVTVSDRAGNRYSLGWGKASGGMLKNHYPKGLRRPY